MWEPISAFSISRESDATIGLPSAPQLSVLSRLWESRRRRKWGARNNQEKGHFWKSPQNCPTKLKREMGSVQRNSRLGVVNVICIVYLYVYVRHLISCKSNQQIVPPLQWFVNYTASLLVRETNIVSWWLFLCQLLGANYQSIIVSP